VNERLRRIAPFALAVCVVLSAVGQLCMKAGMLELNRSLAAQRGVLDLATLDTAAVWTATGLVSYGLSLGLWLVVLVRYPLSLAYPLLSLSYVCVYLGATFWPRLAETATLSRSLGTLAILLGVALVYADRSRASSAAPGETAQR
jgi:undecaprenyl phosphate-alpha-L-ara4N flippase subunit ArnF